MKTSPKSNSANTKRTDPMTSAGSGESKISANAGTTRSYNTVQRKAGSIPKDIQTKFSTLLDMLTYRRPYGSKTTEAFCAKFLDKIPGMMTDSVGNRILTISGKPKTLFSAHTDTVHRSPGMQKLAYDATLNQIFKTDGTPLGADDAAGVWMLLQLIEAKVPGRYIFHAGEEIGGFGSHHIQSSTPELLKDIDRAIAFDRRGTHDIISEQSGGTCCSRAFVEDMSKALRMGHSAARGSFTDTAVYRRDIPECTNISVGYYNEHSPNEYLDLTYLWKLREAALKVKWDELTTQRDPKASFIPPSTPKSKPTQFSSPPKFSSKHDKVLSYQEALRLAILEPEVVARILEDHDTFLDEVAEARRDTLMKKNYSDVLDEGAS